MRYWILHHQHKGLPIDLALKEAGWEYSQKADIALFDTNHHQKLVRMFEKRRSTLVIYPHTAVACWWYDGVMELPEGFKAILVVGEGQKEVQKIITPNIRVESIGWGYCPILPFQNVKKVKRITFAPIHPAGNRLRPEAKQANARAFKKLLSLENVQIVVRMIGSLENNGLWNSPKVIWKNAKPDGSYAEIDIADLVVGEGMYLHLAVARGKPVIALNQHVVNRSNNETKNLPKNWDKYNHLQAYPVDMDDDDDIIKLIDRAMVEQTAWKRRFIGEKMQSENLSNILKDIRSQDGHIRA